MSGIDSFTKLLLHCDGPDASTTVRDSAATPKTVTANGDAQLDTAQSKFGGASALFDGTGDYLSLADHADWAFGTGAFTVDLWVRLNALPSGGAEPFCVFSINTDDINNFRIAVSNVDNTLFAQMVDGGAATIALASAGPALTTGVWYHVAVVRTGNDWVLFLDGVEQGARVTNSVAFTDYTTALYIGSINAGINWLHNGWVDELRVSKGSARWTTGFTPPTEAYSTDAGWLGAVFGDHPVSILRPVPDMVPY